MEIVMGKTFVQLTLDNFGTWTTGTWLKMMWKNLGILEIELLRRDIPSLTLQIERDTYIMVEFSSLYDMDKRTIGRLDCVRLSMDIYAMSDLAT